MLRLTSVKTNTLFILFKYSPHLIFFLNCKFSNKSLVKINVKNLVKCYNL